ncbi:MAG: hypothetical protein LBO80_05060 [Treponema sp.]|jgi:hypothetical protein|nr:hypothetical protein [Treponema sp.]
MKKSVFFAILIVIAAGAFAQSRDRQDREGWRQPPAVTVSGTLSLIDGRIALENDTATYYVAGLERLIGFVDGLKEGAGVTLEGFVRPLHRRDRGGVEKERHLLRVTKVTLDGRNYDLPAPVMADAGPFSGYGFPGPERRMMMHHYNQRHFRNMPGSWMWNRRSGRGRQEWN